MHPINIQSSPTAPGHSEAESSTRGLSLTPSASGTFDHLQAGRHSLHHETPLTPTEEQELFYDARDHFDSLGSQLNERLNTAYQQVREAIPQLKMQLATLGHNAEQWMKEKAKQMADKSSGASLSIAHAGQLAAEHGCQLTIPFHQTTFIYNKHVDDPVFRADYDRVSGSPGSLCLGLAMTWSQSRLRAQSSQLFFEHLDNYRQDSVMARALGIQHIEQQKYPDKINNAYRMLNDILPMLKMKLIERRKLDGQPIQLFFKIREDQLSIVRDSYLTNGREQAFLLLSSCHAMAMHQQTNGKIEFFDPLYGIVSAPDKQHMFAFLQAIMKDDKSGSWEGKRPVSFQLAGIEPNRKS